VAVSNHNFFFVKIIQANASYFAKVRGEGA